MMHESHAISTTARVLESIRYLHHIKQRPVSASEVQTVSELAADTVAESLKRLLETGQIARPGRGIYEPVAKHPEPRAISQTLHPDGTCKIEIGDEVIALTPIEHRNLVRLLGGGDGRSRADGRRISDIAAIGGAGRADSPVERKGEREGRMS